MKDLKIPDFYSAGDILFKALSLYLSSHDEQYIQVWLNQLKDKPYRASYLLRKYDEMPLLEQKAMDLSRGKIADIGAGAGCHSNYLSERYPVTSVELNKNLCSLLSENDNLTVYCLDFFEWKTDGLFDTILLLMNGLGISESMTKMALMFQKLKNLLSPNGQVLIELTDYSYSSHPELQKIKDEEVSFRLSFKGNYSHEFTWVYPTFKNVKALSREANLSCKILLQEEESLLIQLAHL